MIPSFINLFVKGKTYDKLVFIESLISNFIYLKSSKNLVYNY
jgi:hypothetical protein